MKIFIYRAIKRFILPALNVETNILAKTDINLNISVPKPKLSIEVLPLQNDEIEALNIPAQKKQIFHERLNSLDNVCLIARHKSKIIYYSWISLKEMQIGRRKVKLKDNEGFLFDAFCFPQWRGNRLHGYMSKQRLYYLSQQGKQIAYISFLKDNLVASRIQKSLGFVPKKKIIDISIIKFINFTIQKELTREY